MYKLLKYTQLGRKYGNQKPMFIASFYTHCKDVKVFKKLFFDWDRELFMDAFLHKHNPDYNRKCKILGSLIEVQKEQLEKKLGHVCLIKLFLIKVLKFIKRVNANSW